MKINVFEGARRITRLVAIVWFVGWVYDLTLWNPPGDNDLSIKIYQHHMHLEKIKDSALWSSGGVIFIYAFSWSIGWIVRGFTGIPSGKDSNV
ncbi:MAG: hypothetical protein NTZ45_01530 [Methylococcales bacterium]|nr:hypothetical protein [Methylococcales bacterium]